MHRTAVFNEATLVPGDTGLTVLIVEKRGFALSVGLVELNRWSRLGIQRVRGSGPAI